MKTPNRLQPLVDNYLIEEVIRQLPSGKEADVYAVRSEGEIRCAKVYKESNNRSFKQKIQYTEGRKGRNSRQARAMKNKSRYGRQEEETTWQNVEVETLFLLAEAGVRVPTPYTLYEGVLLLEMIVDEQGNPAPRLDEVILTPEQAREYHAVLLQESVRMLCAGYVHGDLSEFNVLVAHDGLVIIDLPQAVMATSSDAAAIFERDIVHLGNFFGRFAPELANFKHSKEIWKIYDSGKLRPNTKLTGLFKESTKEANVAAVLEEIADVYEEEMERRKNRNSDD